MILNIFLTASIAASCIPKQIPKYGISFSRANLIAKILPSEPLLPNPPGTSIPSDLDSLSSRLANVKSSDSIQFIFTFTLLKIPP